MPGRETNPPLTDELVGYLLDALAEPTQREVDAQVRANPQMRRTLDRLRAALAPLECDREESDPPPGLTANTLALVAAYPRGELPAAPRLPRNHAGPRHWWRRSDVLVASVLLFVFLGVAAGWIANGWYYARNTARKDNLRRFHAALTDSAGQREEDLFSQVARQGPFASAEMFMSRQDGDGQNVLYIDGSVRFVSSRVVGTDDSYLNDHRVYAGGREDEWVLGYSDASP